MTKPERIRAHGDAIHDMLIAIYEARCVEAEAIRVAKVATAHRESLENELRQLTAPESK